MERNIPGNIEFISGQAVGLDLRGQIPNKVVVDPNEARLIHQAHTGDNEALGELFENQRNDVHDRAFLMTQDPDLADDLTQEVFIRALGAFPKYEDRGKPIKRWLMVITRNVVSSHFRKREVRDPVCYLFDEKEPVYEQEQMQPEKVLEQKFERRRLYGIMANLSEEQQQIIRMRLGNGLDYEQIGVETGIRNGSARVRFHRGLKRIIKALKDDYALEDGDVA